MPFDIQIEHILFFCILQTLLLIGILLQKRFHQIPNLVLGIIFGLLLSLYVLYLLEYTLVFEAHPNLKAIKRALEQFPAPLIYFYMMVLLDGKGELIPFNKKHAIIPLLFVLLLIPLLINEVTTIFTPTAIDAYFRIYMLFGAISAGMQFVYFGYRLAVAISLKSRGSKSLWKNFVSIKDKRLRWFRLMIILFFVSALIFLFEAIYMVQLGHDNSVPMLISTIFYISLGYLLVINIIQNPAIIHFSSKTTGDLVLKKYEKSGISEEEARSVMEKMNEYMETEKPYLKSDLSIQDLSDALNFPVHTISEVSNGLMGQNFFDYVNNYRVEEFKRLASRPQEKDIKILHLAFDAGFSSKTSFNLAFKKFTGETPSQYLKKNYSK